MTFKKFSSSSKILEVIFSQVNFFALRNTYSAWKIIWFREVLFTSHDIFTYMAVHLQEDFCMQAIYAWRQNVENWKWCDLETYLKGCKGSIELFAFLHISTDHVVHTDSQTNRLPRNQNPWNCEHLVCILQDYIVIVASWWSRTGQKRDNELENSTLQWSIWLSDKSAIGGSFDAIKSFSISLQMELYGLISCEKFRKSSPMPS